MSSAGRLESCSVQLVRHVTRGHLTSSASAGIWNAHVSFVPEESFLVRSHNRGSDAGN